MRLTATAVAAMVAVLGVPRTAPAQVVVDPDSPSGKEYAIPLDAARRDASGARGQAGTAGQPAPLFGEGLGGPGVPDQPEADGGAAKSSGHGAGVRGSGAAASDRARAPAAVRETVEQATRTPGAPPSGPGTALVLGLLAVAVLGLGVGSGIAARRRAARGRT